MSSSDKKAPPSPPPPTSTSNQPIVVAQFVVERSTCLLIRVHKDDEPYLNTAEMIERGKTAKARMGRRDGEFLSLYGQQIPLDCQKYMVIFPLWTGRKDGEDDGAIRVLDSTGVTWWCVQKMPPERKWGKNYLLLVRLRHP